MSCSLTSKLGNITVLNALKAGRTTLMKTVNALNAPHLTPSVINATPMDAQDAALPTAIPGTKKSARSLATLFASMPTALVASSARTGQPSLLKRHALNADSGVSPAILLM